ncbi:MAG: hypothetical protein JNL12_23395 [Planctomycetes bacterium]|nr:hypothetical protein [Planctomycetota bacterium]
MTVPPTPSLVGARYSAQVVQVDVFDPVAVSDALQVQVGLPLPEFELRETFSNELNRDAAVSGDRWLGGAVVQAQIGGDGRHGSFDPTFGPIVEPGVYLWQTDNLTIPASATLDGQTQVVTDGRFYFTDLVVPAGITVRFRGPVPARLFVRGRVDVQGTIDASGADMPSVVGILPAHAGQRISSFNARGLGSSLAAGQNGGLAGPGGGRGGKGGDECLGNVAATAANSGQPGEDLRLQAGHAYAGANIGTGGAGSSVHPANGLTASAISNPIGPSPANPSSLIYRSFFSPGGGGGGYSVPGNQPALPSIAPPFLQPNLGPLAPPSASFNPLPYPVAPPPGYSALNHFLVGGSGGGGGGCHAFGQFLAITTVGQVFLAGHGGTGGGGALALRSGGGIVVQPTGSIVARGGDGVLITANNPNNDGAGTYDSDFGWSSPGGGGSGGTVLLQSARDISVAGSIDTRGGLGSRNGGFNPVQPFLNVITQAGNGAPGFYRLEAATTAQFSGTGVPVFQPAQNTGPLLDTDIRTGSRSTWLLPATLALPVYVRYELLALVQGQPVLFSDDPTVSPLAADDPAGPVQLRLQAGFFDSMTGQVGEASWGPWRRTAAIGADSINRDHGNAVRFDLTIDRTAGPVTVLDLRIVWR